MLVEAAQLLFQLEQAQVDAAAEEKGKPDQEEREGARRTKRGQRTRRAGAPALPEGGTHFLAASAEGGFANVILPTMSLSRLRRISSSSAVVLA